MELHVTGVNGDVISKLIMCVTRVVNDHCNSLTKSKSGLVVTSVYELPDTQKSSGSVLPSLRGLGLSQVLG